MRYFFKTALFSLLAVVLSGCHWRHRSDLVVINGMETESLDPAVMMAEADQRLANDLFEGLLRFNKEGRPVPGVASSWQISPDGCTYTFHLRPNARWSDGTTLVAQDFVDSWHRAMLTETGCPYNYQFFVFKNGERFINGEEKNFDHVGIKALDAHTLKVELAHPTAYFLDLCAFPTLFPVPVKLIKRVGDNWTKPKYMVSNGPYQLKEWLVADHIRFKKNPYYWDCPRVAIKTIDILPIDDATVAYNFYASGAADLLVDKSLIPPTLLQKITPQPYFHSKPFLGDYFLRFNCSKPPFSDIRVRKAFALALDAKRITQKISQGGEIVAYSIIGKEMPGYKPLVGLTPDIKKARELLAQAGYPGGKGFPLISYLYSKGELDQGIAVELQAAWQEILGVHVLLDNKEWKAYLGALSAQDYAIARSSWTADFADPSTFLDLFITNGGNNLTGWGSTEYDNLLKQAEQTLDPAQRIALFQKAEDLLLRQETPIFPLFFFKAMQIYDPKKLGGIEGNATDIHPLSEVYIR